MEARFGCSGRKMAQGGAGANRAKGLEGVPSGESGEGSVVMWAMGDLQGTRAFVVYVKFMSGALRL